MQPHPTLLSPQRIRQTVVANRVLFSAHGSFLDFYRPGEAADRYASYLEARAQGGAGMIILQPVQVHPSSQPLGHHLYEPDDLHHKLSEVASRLHRHGVVVLLQLMHVGAEFASSAAQDMQPLWGFSATPSATSGEVAHEMTTLEIEEVIAAFARVAALAVSAGLDGVELHATHGYLVQQSFSPWANRRTDVWGDKRQFIVRTLQAIRRAVGEQAIVGTRLSVDDYTPVNRGGLGRAGLGEVADDLVTAGLVDMVNTSAGAKAAHYSRAVASYAHPHGLLLDAAREMHATIAGRVPMVGVGRITDPDLAERALAEGVCEMVAMTRAQIADPDLVRKLTRADLPPIRPCVGANIGCVDRMSLSLPITCLHNPEVGREGRGAPAAARTARHVVVVGGGPAGMKAAEVAAVRGHRVTLLERGTSLGGRYRLATTFGRAKELAGTLDWLAERLDAVGVEQRLGVEADLALIMGLSPDIVVLASGARPRLTDVPGDDSIVRWSTDDAMTAAATGRILVVDHLGTLEVSRAAERLACEGAEVQVATPAASLGAQIGFTQIKDQLGRLIDAGVKIRTATRLAAIADGAVRLVDLTTRQVDTVAVDVVVSGMPAHAEVTLRQPLMSVGMPVLVAGDAVAPRNAMLAFREGEAAGRAA